MEILYSSNDLRGAIRKLLIDPDSDDRRVVLVAYVGGKAQAFLPNPKGLEIVCWLQPGSTDPLAIERLIRRGAKIYKSDRVHMKVYWSRLRGCVICSANASGNALGGGIQKEAGVLLPPNAVDIERLWTYTKPEPIKSSDLKRLTILGNRTPVTYRNLTRTQPPEFLEWRTMLGPSDWKLGPWDVAPGFSEEAVTKAKETYGTEPYDYLFLQNGELKEDEWVLSFKVPGVTQIGWMRPDFIVAVGPQDKVFDKAYPFQAVQANPPDSHRPPFKIDAAFRQAFKKTIKAFGLKELDALWCRRPPKSLLDLIEKNLA